MSVSENVRLAAIKNISKKAGIDLSAKAAVNPVKTFSIAESRKRLDKSKSTGTGPKVTRFKRTRTTKTGKKVTEWVVRRSDGVAVANTEKSVAHKYSEAFPVTFSDFYKWVNGDFGWENVDDKLSAQGVIGHATSAYSDYDGTPQGALRAYKAAIKSATAQQRKEKSRYREDNKAVKAATETVKQKLEKAMSKKSKVSSKSKYSSSAYNKKAKSGRYDKASEYKSALKALKR